MATPQFCLGSASPRRAQLLQQLGYEFSQCSADIDETPQPAEAPADYVRRMAQEKGSVLISSCSPLPVLTADTIVVAGGSLLGKPTDATDAQRMLSALSGRPHEVMTAVSLCAVGAAPRMILQVSQVSFRQLDAAEIKRYIATGEPLDKAGAYGVQGIAGCFVNKLTGSYTGVMGLPVYETSELLAEAGIQWGRSIPV